MNLKIFKATLHQGEVISLETIHQYQYIADLDCSNKSEATWFRLAIDTDCHYNEKLMKKQAQKEFDQFVC